VGILKLSNIIQRGFFMLKINPESVGFQQASFTRSSEKAESNPPTNQTSASSEAAQSTENREQVTQSPSPQDSSETQTHQESDFEPGAFQFSGGDSKGPSFTPLVSQSGAAREDIQKAADDSLAQLRDKRIANRLNQLAEVQLQQIKEIRQH
jgi:hypothetical protein